MPRVTDGAAMAVGTSVDILCGGGAPSGTLPLELRCRGGTSPDNPSATRKVKLLVFLLVEEGGAPRPLRHAGP